MIVFDSSPQYACKLDADDDLSSFRQAFFNPDTDLIYLDGNSLGRLPKASIPRLQQVIEEEWGSNLIRSWNQGWYNAPRRIGDKIGGLLGAAPGQALVCDSTSINLFKLAMAALMHLPERTKILSDSLNFPTDLYILQGCTHILGNRHQLTILPSPDGILPDPQAILDAIDNQTALVTFSCPTFKSGSLYDIPAITNHAHQVGALVLWDFSHGVGSIPIALDDWEVDLAVGCCYKYLNGGPGAPAFLYIRRDIQDSMVSPIEGWWGHTNPFAFDLAYQPASGVERFLSGTPPVLSLLAIEPAVDLHLEAGMDRLRGKSIQLSEYLIQLFDARLAQLGFNLGSPRQVELRGSHVSLRHPEGYRICRALIEEMNVIPDFREPDNLRLGLTPIYTSFWEVWEGIDRICRVVKEGRYMNYDPNRQKVT